MSFLEARARALGALAVALAVVLYAVTVAVGGVWRTVPGVAVLLVLVALPGWLLGRTGVTGRVGVLLYEALLAYATGAIVALGVLATGTYVLSQGNGALTMVATTFSGWALWGVAGYAAGMASTSFEDVLRR